MIAYTSLLGDLHRSKLGLNCNATASLCVYKGILIFDTVLFLGFQNVLWGYLEFVVKDVTDQQTALLDNALRMVSQLLSAWKTSVEKATSAAASATNTSGGGSRTHADLSRPDLPTTLHMAEGFALVMLCHLRMAPRRLSLHILRDVKALFKLTGAHLSEMTVLDALDKCAGEVVESCSAVIPVQVCTTIFPLS